LLTRWNSRTHHPVLLDHILDDRLPRGVLRAAILLSYESVQMALKRIAPGCWAQVDRRAQVALRGSQIVKALRSRGERFGYRRALLGGELNLR
jgi:hypothetical protein